MNCCVRALAVGVLVLLVPDGTVRACECPRLVNFEEMTLRADVVFIGKVVATDFDNQDADPDFVDVAVESVSKGKAGGTLRVWDVFSQTSCGGKLRGLGAGSRAQFAVDAQRHWKGPVSSAMPSPRPTLSNACGHPWRAVTDAE